VPVQGCTLHFIFDYSLPKYEKTFVSQRMVLSEYMLNIVRTG